MRNALGRCNVNGAAVVNGTLLGETVANLLHIIARFDDIEGTNVESTRVTRFPRSVLFQTAENVGCYAFDLNVHTIILFDQREREKGRKREREKTLYTQGEGDASSVCCLSDECIHVVQPRKYAHENILSFSNVSYSNFPQNN